MLYHQMLSAVVFKKPVHSVIIESRQTKCPIWRVLQWTGS